MSAPRTRPGLWPLCTALWAGVALREGLQDNSRGLILFASIAIAAGLLAGLLTAIGGREQR